MDADLATGSARPSPGAACVLLRPLAEALVALALTAALVLVATDAVLDRVSVQGLTLNVLLRDSPPFPGLGTAGAGGLALRRSGVLLLAALGGAALLGVGAGVAYATTRFRFLRAASWALGTVGVALPSFFWAMLLQLAVIAIVVRTGRLVLPTQGYGLDRHLLLPALALGARPVAYLFRTTATAVEEARHHDFIRLARAKGLDERRVLLRHLLPTAAPAILGGLGLATRGALSSLAIVEYVFDWQGAGYGFIWAVIRGDQRLASALAVAFALLFALVGGATTIGSRLLDPRIAR